MAFSAALSNARNAAQEATKRLITVEGELVSASDALAAQCSETKMYFARCDRLAEELDMKAYALTRTERALALAATEADNLHHQLAAVLRKADVLARDRDTAIQAGAERGRVVLDMESALDGLQDEKNQLLQRLEEISDEALVLNVEKKALRCALKAVKGRLAESDERLRIAHQRIATLEDRIEMLEGAVAERDSDIFAMKLEVDMLTEQEKEAQDMLKAETAVKNAVEHELSLERSKTVDLEGRLTISDGLLFSAQDTVKALAAKIKELEDAKDNLGRHVEDLNAGYMNMVPQLARANSRADDLAIKVAELEATLKGSTSEELDISARDATRASTRKLVVQRKHEAEGAIRVTTPLAEVHPRKQDQMDCAQAL